jgi:hypothetical protein
VLLFKFQILIYKVGAYQSLHGEKLQFLYALVIEGEVKNYTHISLSKRHTEDTILYHHHVENKFWNNQNGPQCFTLGTKLNRWEPNYVMLYLWISGNLHSEL